MSITNLPALHYEFSFSERAMDSACMYETCEAELNAGRYIISYMAGQPMGGMHTST